MRDILNKIRRHMKDGELDDSDYDNLNAVLDALEGKKNA